MTVDVPSPNNSVRGAQLNPFAALAIVIAVLACLQGCAANPYVTCNMKPDDWEYVPGTKLNEIDIEARRLVTSRSMAELLRGEVVQHWFKSGDNELFLCRQSRSAKDFCFSTRTRFVRENGVWKVTEDDDALCTE